MRGESGGGGERGGGGGTCKGSPRREIACIGPSLVVADRKLLLFATTADGEPASLCGVALVRDVATISRRSGRVGESSVDDASDVDAAMPVSKLPEFGLVEDSAEDVELRLCVGAGTTMGTNCTESLRSSVPCALSSITLILSPPPRMVVLANSLWRAAKAANEPVTPRDSSQ
eukprot:scaffold137695_cov27-Tisochrysis_lutea.AAC.3